MVCVDTKECLRLAAIASEETRFASHVLNGDCNRQGWRALHKSKACDGGLAFGRCILTSMHGLACQAKMLRALSR